MAGVIVLDASVLIAYLDGDATHHAAAETILAEAIDDDLAISSLTLAEVLVAPIRMGRLDLVQAVLRDLEMRELSFPAEVAERLVRLRADTGLKMPDCCVLLAAEESGASVATFDDRLARAASTRGLTVLGS